MENPATIANFALNTAKYNLPSDYYQNYLKNLAAVSVQNVQQVANKYVLPQQMHIVIVGNAKEVAKGLEKYGDVKYFNVYGEEVQAPTAKTVDASVTPESILQKAVTAYGGDAAITAVKDIQMNGEASIQGQKISVVQRNIPPATYSVEVGMQGMVLQKKSLKDGKYTLMEQGQTKEADAKEKEEINEDAAVFPEPYLLAHKDYQMTVKGVEQVEGKDAYAVGVKTPAGREYTLYYDLTSGMLVKKTQVQEGGPMGSVTINSYISEYKPFNGVQIPTRVVNDLGMMKFDIKFTDVKVNSGLKAEDIK